MRINQIALGVAMLSFTACNQAAKEEGTDNASSSIDFTDENQKVGYAIGLDIVSNVKHTSSVLKDVDLKAMAAAILDNESENGKMTLEDAKKTIQEYQQAQHEKQQQEKEVKAKANKDAGEAFLAKNGARPEVTTTESGLQYEVLVEGTGPKPTENDKVKVHYHGTLLDNTVFDSSVDRGEPAEFGVTQVIKGWIEGLQLMPTGSKWKLFIPSDLAYGDHGTQGIDPGSTLIFEVELLEIIKQ